MPSYIKIKTTKLVPTVIAHLVEIHNGLLITENIISFFFRQ